MKKTESWDTLNMYHGIPIWKIFSGKHVVDSYYFAENFETALNNARKLGGKIYKANWYKLSGFVFLTDNPEALCKKIANLNNWGPK
jgi:hypothetical protein